LRSGHSKRSNKNRRSKSGGTRRAGGHKRRRPDGSRRRLEIRRARGRDEVGEAEGGRPRMPVKRQQMVGKAAAEEPVPTPITGHRSVDEEEVVEAEGGRDEVINPRLREDIELVCIRGA
jgi:hypothetical protein